jgi:hypothetical protein
VFAAEIGAPYEQTEFDRAVPSAQDNASYGATLNSNVWAQDYNFIAPAQ